MLIQCTAAVLETDRGLVVFPQTLAKNTNLLATFEQIDPKQLRDWVDPLEASSEHHGSQNTPAAAREFGSGEQVRMSVCPGVVKLLAGPRGSALGAE